VPFPIAASQAKLLLMRAEVISIGDEMTTGQRLDTNSQWLSQQLTDLGIEVAFHTTVGDELADNILVFQNAIERADIVVATGGLGPTADDLTRDALAAATGTKLWRDPESLARIEQLFKARGREMPERNVVQADFPDGATPIPNPHGTAPGIEMIVPRADGTSCAVFALPGVPVEMHEMWQATVANHVREMRPQPSIIRHRRIKCFGTGESQLEAMLPDLIRRGREPKVGITVSDATITLRIAAAGVDEATCLSAMEPTVTLIRELLGELVFGEEDDELEHVDLRLLSERGQTMAVAEWATEGVISNWLTALDPVASTVLRCAVIENMAQLNSLCEMPADAEPHDPAVAVALAESIRLNARSDWGLGIAAYPSDPFSADAHVCIAIASAENTRKLRFGCASHPAILKVRTAKQALNALRLELLKRSSSRV
jgi:nicotinamide-nucleotide amidase